MPSVQCTRLIFKADGPVLIILALVPANIRNGSLSSCTVRALDIFLALAYYLTDGAKLDCMVPYIVEFLRDGGPQRSFGPPTCGH